MLSGHEIRMLRTAKKMTQAEFGSLFEKSAASVGAWENDSSIPKTKTMSTLEKLHREQFDKSKIMEDNMPYLKDGEMGQAEPYENTEAEGGQLEGEARRCRVIAAEYYDKLSPRGRAEIDIRAAAIIMEKFSHEVAGEKD